MGLPLPPLRSLPYSSLPCPFPCSSPSPGTNSGCPPPPPSPPSPPCWSSLHPVRNSGCAVRNSGCAPPDGHSGCASPPQPTTLPCCRSHHDPVTADTGPILAHLCPTLCRTWGEVRRGPDTPYRRFSPRLFPRGEEPYALFSLVPTIARPSTPWGGKGLR